MNSKQWLAIAATSLSFGLVWSTSARAQDEVPPPPPPPPAAEVQVQAAPPPVVQSETETTHAKTVPNFYMLGSGLVTFGLSYGVGVVVAGTSSRPEDQHLYVPLAGPWIDLGDRGGCGGTTGRSCDTETTYKVLLGVDGVVQAIGALVVLDSFFTPESHTVSRTTTAAKADKPKVHFSPASVGSGYGFLALGTF
jgi:hypothetical protein